MLSGVVPAGTRTGRGKSELQQDIDRVQSGCFGGATTLTDADLSSLAEKWLRQLR